MPANPIAEFESAFATYHEAAAARAFWMGRIGLYAVLKALGVGKGDPVGICSYTCVGVVESVTRLRAKPVFLDVDRDMNIDPAALENLARRAGAGEPLKALVLQHTFGVPCDVKASLAWAARTGTPVIEDCCHSLGATVDGRRVGRFGAAAVFSFQWGKPYSTGQGGMVTFNDAALAAEVDRLLKVEGIEPSAKQNLSLAVQRTLFRSLVTPRTKKAIKAVYKAACRAGLIGGSEPSSADLVGNAENFLRRAGAGQAAAGVVGMKHWPELMQRRNTHAAQLIQRLQQAGVAVRTPRPGDVPMYLRVPVWVKSKSELLHRADKLNLDVAGWYMTPAHPFSGQILTDLGYDPATCPTAEQAFRDVVTLPTWPAMSGPQMDRAVGLIRDAM